MPHLPDHQSDHDPLLIAAFAAGDADDAELERARLLVATCEECAALHHDLRSIAAAMPAVPAPVRRRDFRLSPEQAQELRPSGWRRLLAPLAGPRFTFAAPLGGSLAALGLAGILVAGAASTPIANPATGGGRGNEGTGTGSGMPAYGVRDDGAGAAAAGASVAEVQRSAASAAPAGPLAPTGASQPSARAVQPGAAVAASAAASSDTGTSGGTAPAGTDTSVAVPAASPGVRIDASDGIDAAKNPADASGPISAPTLAQGRTSATTPSPLLAGGVVLLLVGGVLVAARWVARRVG